MKFLGIIPARYHSTRFPGKPLANLGDTSVLHRVYQGCQHVLDDLYVATDDERIFQHVADFGGNVVMTSEKHQSGTDRCGEAMDSVIAGTGEEPDVIINIQGDEPFINREPLEQIMNCFDDSETQIATLCRQFSDPEEVFNENSPKVVLDNRNFALYFSRSPIPFVRGKKHSDWLNYAEFYKHLGIYAYKKEVLKELCKLKISALESAESLEQLRWLQNGYRIKVAETRYSSVGIDTPADLRKALQLLRNPDLNF